jgi:hypothetical protein
LRGFRIQRRHVLDIRNAGSLELAAMSCTRNGRQQV